MKKANWPDGPRGAALAGIVLAFTACGRGPGEAPAPAGPSGPLPQAHAAGLPWPAGTSRWTWTADGGTAAGQAQLHVTTGPDGGSWRWEPDGDPPPAAGVRLQPRDDRTWLPLTVPAGAAPGAWLPLPRVAVASTCYTDLVDLLRDLTAPRFAGRVTTWPSLPVPVRIPAARSGEVDLAACLREAVGRWNAGAARPWFACTDTADWGVRLVHLAGSRLQPPLAARITRLDSLGRPLRVHIIAGDNYDDRRDSIYAVRGLVHELGHALFLWGHSRDRRHVLWGAAPPLAGWPSPDERKAALLWHGLPESLDLGRYGPVIPP